MTAVDREPRIEIALDLADPVIAAVARQLSEMAPKRNVRVHFTVSPVGLILVFRPMRQGRKPKKGRPAA